MVEHEKWTLEQQIQLFSRFREFEPYLNAGVFYGYRRDKQSRPVIVFSMKRALDNRMEVEQFLELADFFCSYI